MKILPALVLALSASAAAAADSTVSEPREAKPDFSGDIAARKSYWVPAAEIVGFDFLLNQFDRRYFGCCDFDSNIHTIRRNLRSSWVVDRDPFTVNQLGHPYQGSMYHGFARASGLGYWEASAYTFLGSAFWEIAGETTTPSRNDQINTGIGGAFLGEALFRMANLALEHEEWGWRRELAAAAMSPPVGFNRAAFGERFRSVFPSRGPVYFARLQLGFSGSDTGQTGLSGARIHRNEALADFYMDYGLPGKREYEYTRPFDYFSFQATASSANGFENAMTRGLLLGKAYDSGRDVRGVLGLYGSYDYIAPQTFRMGSTALSLGTTAQWRITPKWQLMGTLMGGVGYAAASTTLSTGDGNDYHYGFAPQGLASVRLAYGSLFALDVTAREYYVSRIGAAQRGGHENIARFDAAFTWRVYKRHGVSFKYLGNRRDESYPDLGDRTQRRQTIGVFYTLLGHDRFGAVEWE